MSLNFSSYIIYGRQPYHPAAQDRFPLELSRVELVSIWMETPVKTRLLLEEVLVRPAGGAHHRSVWVITPQCSDGDTILSKAPSFGYPGQTSPLASDHHGLLIIPIHRLASSLSPLHLYLVCGGRSGALWLPSYRPGGRCTLVVDEEISTDNVERFECLEKQKTFQQKPFTRF